MATAVAASLLLWFVLGVPSGSFHDAWTWAAVTAVTFACAAWLMKAVSTSGALAGSVVAFICYSYGKIHLFSVLLLVFLLTWTATLAGRRKKARIENGREHSRRTAPQVMANLAVSAAAIVYAGSHAREAELFYLICIAALAEAAADTVSSEIGKAYNRKTVLITTLRACPPGIDGGVSWVGSLAGIAAAVATVGAAMPGQMGLGGTLTATAAACLGMFADSLAGALWERHGIIGNEVVNLIGTSTAALLAWLAMSMF